MFETEGCSPDGWAIDNLLRVEFPNNPIGESSPCQLHILATQIVHSILGSFNIILGSLLLTASFKRQTGDNSSRALRISFFFGAVQSYILGLMSIIIASGSGTRSLIWSLFSTYFCFHVLFAAGSVKVILDILSTMMYSAAGATFTNNVLRKSIAFKVLFVSYNTFFIIAATSFWVYTITVVIPGKPFDQGLLAYQLGCCGFGLGMASLILDILIVFDTFANFIEETINSAPSSRGGGESGANGGESKFHEKARKLVARFREMRNAMKVNSVMSCLFFFLHAFVIPIYATYVLPLHCLNNVMGWGSVLHAFFPSLTSCRFKLRKMFPSDKPSTVKNELIPDPGSNLVNSTSGNIQIR